jgi:phospholipase C
MDKIKHLILLTMENRSFDHYLGALTLEGRSDVEGLSAFSQPP